MLGILQMSVEFQVPSPLVPTRESYFVRYCKQNADGSWAVVDVSLDSLCPSSVLKCRRRPSGCLIQEMPNGYSKVCGLYMIDFSSLQIFSVADGSDTNRKICTVFIYTKLMFVVHWTVCQVTWVEHVEVDDRSVHSIYKLLVNAGLAFGARRWVGTLDRQCERLASVMASNIPTSDIGGKALYHASQHTIYALSVQLNP